MQDRKTRSDEKEPYVKPKVLATYQKEDLEETFKAHAQTTGGGGCGCGCGVINP